MSLDNRAWLAWGLAASVPAIASRNPCLLAELGVVVLVTHHLAGPSAAVRWLVRLALVFAVISVAFNVLTVHAGDRVIGRLPRSLPIIGGDLTLNALVYGAISAVAIVVIVLTWLTVSANLNWIVLMRQLPDRAAPIAAAGSIAWAWLPAMQITLRDIRESQRSRGVDRFSARQLPALVLPLLAGGLERSLTTSDVLDARGFGGGVARSSPFGAVLVVLAVTAIAASAYVGSAGYILAATIVAAFGAGLGWFGLRAMPAPPRRTRWRTTPWTAADTAVCFAAGLSVMLIAGRAWQQSEVLTYSTYPTIAIPTADPVAMGVLLLLFAPAMVLTHR